jgi:hypothetical protein
VVEIAGEACVGRSATARWNAFDVHRDGDSGMVRAGGVASTSGVVVDSEAAQLASALGSRRNSSMTMSPTQVGVSEILIIPPGAI